MNGTVSEWIEKAEGDYDMAQRALRPDPVPRYDAACFHAQQCIEKLMKGFLVSRRIQPLLTHNLFQLAEVIRKECPLTSWADKDLRYLTRVGMGFRYPGESADGDDAGEAMAVCRALRADLLSMLRSA
jgi:HEPN domain-containing protein